MSDLPLRAACIHGRYDFHYYWSESERAAAACPGSREVTYEAAAEAIRAVAGWDQWNQKPILFAQAALAAAIGDTDAD